jgi:hypothetical protein
MKNFLTPILLLILLLPSSSLAEGENISVQLQCDGILRVYNDDGVSKPMEISMRGIFIEISEKTVLVAGSSWWDGELEITRKDAASIHFKSMNNANYYGAINRYVGDLQLSIQIPEDNRHSHMLLGSCIPAKPLF